MSNWTATNELRFIDRQHEDGWWTTGILQQKWEDRSEFYDPNGCSYEWRDVPVVEEE